MFKNYVTHIVPIPVYRRTESVNDISRGGRSGGIKSEELPTRFPGKKHSVKIFEIEARNGSEELLGNTVTARSPKFAYAKSEQRNPNHELLMSVT